MSNSYSIVLPSSDEKVGVILRNPQRDRDGGWTFTLWGEVPWELLLGEFLTLHLSDGSTRQVTPTFTDPAAQAGGMRSARFTGTGHYPF
jgi:hypothetical protein